ncbi:hypothetical protein [Maribacter sp. 2210JD10-5]|uniref:hypothetical protein n=1 Tax=Maribacter sp. 2210JD10-5 TaxID=3386272 RepID=UPI0039BD6A91
MFDELDKYKSNGHFFFSADDELSTVCNAPKNGVGIYIVYALKGGKIELIYIGSSGKILQSGHKKVRIGGMCDRLVNGKQFGDARKRSWKTKLISEKIEALDIYWYETFDKANRDIPNTVEGIIIQRFYEVYGVLPKWNKEY